VQKGAKSLPGVQQSAAAGCAGRTHDGQHVIPITYKRRGKLALVATAPPDTLRTLYLLCVWTGAHVCMWVCTWVCMCVRVCLCICVCKETTSGNTLDHNQRHTSRQKPQARPAISTRPPFATFPPPPPALKLPSAPARHCPSLPCSQAHL
jgi:hypothetical protein